MGEIQVRPQDVSVKLIEGRHLLFLLKDVQLVLEEWCAEAEIHQYHIIGPFEDSDGIQGILLTAIGTKVDRAKGEQNGR